MKNFILCFKLVTKKIKFQIVRLPKEASGQKGGYMGRWVDVQVGQWVDGKVGNCKINFLDCLQPSINQGTPHHDINVHKGTIPFTLALLPSFIFPVFFPDVGILSCKLALLDTVHKSSSIGQKRTEEVIFEPLTVGTRTNLDKELNALDC
jgi:hypothetical protein